MISRPAGQPGSSIAKTKTKRELNQFWRLDWIEAEQTIKVRLEKEHWSHLTSFCINGNKTSENMRWHDFTLWRDIDTQPFCVCAKFWGRIILRFDAMLRRLRKDDWELVGAAKWVVMSRLGRGTTYIGHPTNPTKYSAQARRAPYFCFVTLDCLQHIQDTLTSSVQIVRSSLCCFSPKTQKRVPREQKYWGLPEVFDI